MPLPTPTAGESQSDFVDRCMAGLSEEFPDATQRAAVCHSQWHESRPEQDTAKLLKHFSAVLRMPGTQGREGMLVSTENLDFDRDRVMAARMEADLRNLPLLWCHDRASIPIGRVMAVEARPGVGVYAEWVWNDGDEFGARVRRAWDAGFVRGASIGFIPVERVPNAYGGDDHLKWRLIEVSLTPTPANPHAVRELHTLGLFESEPIVRVSGVGVSLDDVMLRVHAAAGGIVLDEDAPPAGLSLDGQPLTQARLRALVVPEVTVALHRAMERAMRRGLESAFCRLTGRVD